VTVTSDQNEIHSPEIARKMWRTLEPYHGIVYFTPYAEAEYAKLGITGRDGYFASRSAPLGAASAELVISTFFNFHPSLVRHAIPAVWERVSPEAIVAARLRAADSGLRELLGDGVGGDEVAEAAALAERAARRVSIVGRPLCAGHASLRWPEEPHLVLWHAISILREYRGDGHIAALVSCNLDACEALVTHAAVDGSDIPDGVLQRSRAWPEDEWEAAKTRLTARGLYEGDRLTAAGTALRERIEALTDDLAADAWAALSVEEAERLRTLVRPWSRAIVESGVFGMR
jgi:hypothetical protein